jgi:hypothetical protein
MEREPHHHPPQEATPNGSSTGKQQSHTTDCRRSQCTCFVPSRSSIIVRRVKAGLEDHHSRGSSSLPLAPSQARLQVARLLSSPFHDESKKRPVRWGHGVAARPQAFPSGCSHGTQQMHAIRSVLLLHLHLHLRPNLVVRTSSPDAAPAASGVAAGRSSTCCTCDVLWGVAVASHLCVCLPPARRRHGSLDPGPVTQPPERSMHASLRPVRLGQVSQWPCMRCTDGWTHSRPSAFAAAASAARRLGQSSGDATSERKRRRRRSS